jgi:hypothetical protein
MISFYPRAACPDQDHRPPRRARTKCNTDPAAILKSLAVLSSGLGAMVFSTKVYWGHITTDICLPPKISRCCGGGTPDCSSTFSLIRVIYGNRNVAGRGHPGQISHPRTHFIIEINVKLDLGKIFIRNPTQNISGTSPRLLVSSLEHLFACQCLWD